MVRSAAGWSTARTANAPSFGVVVISYNAGRTIRQCLISILEQTCPPDEVVLVDCGSTDSTLDVAATFPSVTVLHDGQGPSRQRNAGAAALSSDYVCFIDSDMVLEPGLFEECIGLVDSGTTCIVLAEAVEGTGFWGHVRQLEKALYQDISFIEGLRWLPRVEFEAVGGFDEELISGEDWDLDERVRGRQQRVGRTRAAAVSHEPAQGLRHLLGKKAYYADQDDFARFRQRHPQRAALALSPRVRLGLLWQRRSQLRRSPGLAVGLLVLGGGELVVTKSRRLRQLVVADPWAERAISRKTSGRRRLSRP